MAVSDWNTNPDYNLYIDNIYIGQNCAPGNVDNAIRSIMASVKVAFQGIPSTANFVTKTGGVFLSNPTYNGQGGYYHSTDPAMTSGRVTIQPEGTALPTGAPGDIVFSF